MGHKQDRVLVSSAQPSHLKFCKHGPTWFSISRSTRTSRSRPCCNTLFLLFAWNIPPITSALYPYVHTLALGMSWVRYSSGQKSLVDRLSLVLPLGIEVRVGIKVGVEVNGLDLKKGLKKLCLFNVAFPTSSMLASRLSSHMRLGCPLMPCTKTMLHSVSCPP